MTLLSGAAGIGVRSIRGGEAIFEKGDRTATPGFPLGASCGCPDAACSVAFLQLVKPFLGGLRDSDQGNQGGDGIGRLGTMLLPPPGACRR
jgi:hypothetical protein